MSRIDLILPRVVGVTGRTGTASPLVWPRSMKHLGRREHRSDSPGLTDAQESWMSPEFTTIFPRQGFWVSFHGDLARCSVQHLCAGLMILGTCEAVPHLLNYSWVSDPVRQCLLKLMVTPQLLLWVGIRLVAFSMGVCLFVKSPRVLQEEKSGANAWYSFSIFLPHDCWQMWPVTNPWNMAVQTEMGQIQG